MAALETVGQGKHAALPAGVGVDHDQGVLQRQDGDQGVDQVDRSQLADQHRMRPALPHMEEGHGDFVGGIGGHSDGGDLPHVDRLFHPHHEGDGQEQRKVQREQERRGRQKDLLPQKLFFRFRLGSDPVFRQQDGAPEDDQQKIEYADAFVPDRRKKRSPKTHGTGRTEP